MATLQRYVKKQVLTRKKLLPAESRFFKNVLRPLVDERDYVLTYQSTLTREKGRDKTTVFLPLNVCNPGHARLMFARDWNDGERCLCVVPHRFDATTRQYRHERFFELRPEIHIEQVNVVDNGVTWGTYKEISADRPDRRHSLRRQYNITYVDMDEHPRVLRDWLTELFEVSPTENTLEFQPFTGDGVTITEMMQAASLSKPHASLDLFPGVASISARGKVTTHLADDLMLKQQELGGKCCFLFRFRNAGDSFLFDGDRYLLIRNSTRSQTHDHNWFHTYFVLSMQFGLHESVKQAALGLLTERLEAKECVA